MNAKLAQKNEELADINRLLAHDAWPILKKEMERIRDKGIADCCDVTKTQTERDAGAGAKKAAEELLNYLPAKAKSLEASTKKRSLPNQGQQ